MSDIDGGLRGLFRSNIPQFMWTSIETGGTGRGIADSHYLAPPPRRGLPGVEGWVEYKQTSGWTPSVRPEQVAFADRRARLGGRIWIAVRRWNDRGDDELWLVHGRHVRLLVSEGGLRNAMIQRDSPVFVGGPSRWQWPTVAEFLVSWRP